ncbi:PD-(D/E)XK nuclease family protein [Hufsiella ginkgonis]|uniref:PD-(D/E)XK nuclease family protein n=1 Tax=Hufsiella ginkgonis TaxID=2695274 RepID=A0A7K1XS86_9SPHI|nr:PD-(D/E)XK nuclease family protein [Hufsiella ginkgonis]MXV13717.1 PD-(D/E)XK nuclease family protein [Hufsiella ginkgonis]
MKTFLHEVATDLLARFGDDLKDVAIVFSNKRPVLFLKKHLGEVTGRSSWSPAFFTVQEFFAKSTSLVIADPVRQFFVLHSEFNKLLLAENKTTLSPDQFYPMAEIILNDFSQIDYDQADAAALFCELEDIAVIQQQFPHLGDEQYRFMQQFWGSFSKEKQNHVQQRFIDLWKRMPRLYQDFHAALEREGLITAARVSRRLAGGDAGIPGFTDQYKKLVFVGFNALNHTELSLFKHWQEQDRALFYFDADAWYLNDPLQEAGLFIRKNLAHGLENALGDPPALIAGSVKKVRVTEAQGHAAQAKAIALFADSALLAAQSDDPEHTAIIVADESLLIPVMQSIPPEAGTVNVTMGYPLAQSSVFGLIDLWLSVQEQVYKEKKEAVYFREVDAFLSHPLTGVSEQERSQLQKQIFEHQWINVPLTALHFVSSLATNFFAVTHQGLQGIDALYVLLTAVLEQRQRAGQLQQLESNLILAVSRNLNLLYDGLADYASSLPLPFVFSLIRKSLQGLSVPLEGEPLKGIQVMGMLESRCLDFKEVIILGANEGTLPKLTAPHTFIPDSIRRAHGLPVPENQDAISAYLFYRLLQRSRHVHVVYNNLVDETNSGEQSRFLRQLEFEGSHEFSYSAQRQKVSVEPLRELTVAKEGEVWETMRQFFRAKELKDEKLSATAITTYLNCQLQFFFKYIAKVREPEALLENLEANQVGSMLHRVLQWFYEALVKDHREITADRIREKRKEIPSLCLNALSVELFKKENQLQFPNSMQQIILRIVAEYAEAILVHDEAIAPFRIVELENNTDYIRRFPVNVMGKAEEVLLYGIIDRVDIKEGVTRIVDYKTGGRDEVKYAYLDDLFERDGKRQNKAMLQTLFYTYVYEQVKGVTLVEPNLYIIRKMRNDGTLFFSGGRGGKVLLQAEHLEELKSGFRDHLQTLLEELFNPDIPFTHTTKEENCTFCPYREICGK